jgi:hypothetical protein
MIFTIGLFISFDVHIFICYRNKILFELLPHILHVLVFDFHVLCLDLDLGIFLFCFGLILWFNNLFILNFFHLLCHFNFFIICTLFLFWVVYHNWSSLFIFERASYGHVGSSLSVWNQVMIPSSMSLSLATHFWSICLVIYLYIFFGVISITWWWTTFLFCCCPIITRCD